VSERIVIIGPGRMGLALGSALLECGAAETLTFYGRSMDPPPHPIFEPDHARAEYRYGIPPLPPRTTVAILAVSDGALPEVAHNLAAAGPPPAGCAALHLAGALSAEVLGPLHAVGYAVGSMHPLQTIADPWSSGDRLIGAAYALGGDPAAMAAARRLVSAVRGLPLVIPPPARPTYHASAVFASNYLIALVSVVVRLMAQAGLDEGTAVEAALPLIRGTLDNLEHLGVAAALTGPIVRGDVDTVRLHLRRLSGADRMLYCALGRETLQLARAIGLDPDRAAEIESLLSFE